MKYTENNILITLGNLVTVILLCLLLVSCNKDERMKELEQYVAQQKQMVIAKSKSQAPSVAQLPKPVTYRNAITPEGERPSAISKGAPLQRYPLRSLQFVGTIVHHKKISAYIMTPDNLVYSVNVGDVIGDNYGKITKIAKDHIEILERTTKLGASKPTEQIVTMLLKE